MSVQEIANAVMELPEQERLEVARRVVATIAEREVDKAIAAAIPGIEDVVTGKVKGLSEEEFRDALK
jgi:hypothetical protein